MRTREWALVRALAELRGAPAEPAYLAALARAGSWVRFLAEADTQAYPLRLVRRPRRTRSRPLWVLPGQVSRTMVVRAAV